MKRKIFSLSLTLLLGLFSWNATAATGWFSDYIKLDVNGAGVAGPTGYKWIGTDPAYGSSLVTGLGTVTSLKLDGADMKYWSDTQDRSGGSFFYEIKSADGVTTYIAATEVIWTQTALGGNDFQGVSSGLNVDLLAGIPSGTACKLTVWAKSWGTGQGDSWLTNGGANYVATFNVGPISITGATGIANGTLYSTLKGAFDAINANTSGVNTDEIAIKVAGNTTETATAVLNPSKGINTLTTAAGSGYQGPVITLTGGTTSAAGSVTTTITNGVITSITMTGGTWTAAPTVSIATPAGGGTRATATASGTSGNTTFTITNGGTGYGPTATFTGDGTGAAVNVIMTTAATTVSGASSPRTVTPATVGLTYTLTCPGSGYSSAPSCSISSVAGGTGGTVTVASLYPSIEFSKLAIYPTVIGKTITGAVGIISIVGRKNVTIDGRVNRTGAPAVGSTDNLTISTTHATNPAIQFNSNAQNDTIQYCTLKGKEATSSLGIVNFGTAASLANGNGLNVIDHNLITSYDGIAFTMPTYGIYAQGNSAFPNASNQITNNEFKDLISQYNTSSTIYILGGITAPQNDNYTISGNSFYSGTLPNYATQNYTRTMLQIGSTAAAFGGSHTISGNYIGGSAAGCSGTLTKTDKEATFYGMLIYPSPTVTSGGGLTRIQGNTIQNIRWTNGYFPAGWNAINIGGGTGGVSIGTSTPNTIGDNTTNGSITIINNGASTQSANMISISTTGSVICQNNKIGSITASNTGGGNYALNVTGIVKSAVAGTTTISNNVIGSTTQANSISTTSSSPATLTASHNQSIIGIVCSGTGTNTISNNTIANITSNMSGTITTPGAFTASGSAYGVQCNAGSGANTVSGNTIFNIKNNVASIITGNIFAITMSGTTGIINGNLIHSNTIIGATTGTLYGIWCATGANTVSNNIVKLGDDNSYEIRAVGDASGANNTKIFHNTIYLSGTPTSLALSSAALFSSGQTTIRSYKNNICYNARSNGTGSTSVHYAFNANSVSGAGVIYSDGNCYYAPGVGGKIGRFSSDKTTMPVVTGHDSTSVNIAPSFVNVGGTTASDYKLTSATSMTGVSSTGVGLDFDGATRTGTIIGAFEMASLTTSTSTLTGLNYVTGAGPAFYLHSFDVSGDAISGNITVTAPTNFEVSKTGVTSEFTPSVTVTAANGSVAATPIYVRLVAGLAAATYTADVTVSAAGATSKTVSCTGIVDITVGVKNATSDELRIVNSKGQVTIIGAKAGQLIQVYNASGLLINSTIATSGDNRVSLSNGLQIIKVGSAVRKVLVK